MRESLRSRRVVVAGVGVSVFSLELLCTAAWAVLRLARRSVEAAGGAVAVWLPESLFLLSSPTCLFPRPRRCLVEVTGPKGLLSSLSSLIRLLLQLCRRLVEVTGLKGSLLSDAYVAPSFDGALFAVVV